MTSMPTAGQGRHGSTLVEVMFALLISTVLVLGVAAFIYYGRASVYAQRDRLSVLERVNQRLEWLRSEPYTSVQPPAENFSTYWMRTPTVSGWRFYTSRRTQNVTVNTRRYRMETTVQYVDADGGSPSYDALLFTVSMRYRTGSNDEITISTYRAQE